MTKQEIIEATLDLACEKGIGRISMQQIADRVNLKKSSLYSHFKSKEEIIEGMYVYIREKAKQQTGNTDVDYGKYVDGRSLNEILTGVVASYRNMGATSDMNRFFAMIMAERTFDQLAALKTQPLWIKSAISASLHISITASQRWQTVCWSTPIQLLSRTDSVRAELMYWAQQR